MPRAFNPNVMDLARRFHPTGDHQTNANLLNDPEGFSLVAQETLDQVDYPRPPFNWPSGSSPQSNFFVIEGMAVDTLAHSGFAREAASLRARLRLHPPAYADLPSLLHRYLDLEPAIVSPAKLAKLQALADDMDLDAATLGKVQKKKINNNLSHKSKTAQEEWAWLVAHADDTSVFGKTAACALSLPTMLALVDAWLPQIGAEPVLPASDASFANLAWFRSAFPLGWSHIDHLGESAVVSAPSSDDFASRLALAYFEMSDKISRGWNEKDARLFAFSHKNHMDMNGAALFALGANDHFEKRVLPILYGQASAARSAPTGLFSRRVQELHPELAGQQEDMTLWILYRAVDPESSSLIQAAYMEPDKAAKLGMPSAFPKGPVSRGAALARLERLELEATHTDFWSFGPAAPLPAAAVAQKNSMRL